VAEIAGSFVVGGAAPTTTRTDSKENPAMAEEKYVDPSVNPQAMRPGNVLPERTPGTAPSVVPLPSGADPTAKPGEHPLPEDAIEGYPKVAAAAASGDPVAYAEAAGGEPDPNDIQAEPVKRAAAPTTAKTSTATPSKP
jgi:hypothetical protein